MDVNTYVDLMESDHSLRNVERLGSQVERDASLRDEDREFLLERVRMYRADGLREHEPPGGWTLRTAPDELG